MANTSSSSNVDATVSQSSAPRVNVIFFCLEPQYTTPYEIYLTAHQHVQISFLYARTDVLGAYMNNQQLVRLIFFFITLFSSCKVVRW